MASEIRVLHLSTFDQGGAATAALRLHAGLLQQGVKSSFMSLQQANPEKVSGMYKFKRKTREKTLLDRIQTKLGNPVTQAKRNDLRMQDLKGDYETFSFPETDHRVENDPMMQEVDIIHLHWISYFVNQRTFFNAINRPIIWTFHDMNPVMGGFHYQGDLERNPAFMQLEAQLRKEKLKYFSQGKNLTVVTPSRWLGEAAAHHEALGTKPRHHIPYGLNTSVFKPLDPDFSRTVFDFPPGKKIVLFVTERVSNYRKGFDLLMEAVRDISADTPYVIVTIGNSNAELSSFPNVIALGRVHDEHLLSVLYSAADVFVLPSREDNFPNVMLEALACGTPVIAFDTGGMAEVIQTGVNGILVKDISSLALRGVLNDFLRGKFVFDRKAIRQNAVAQFDLSVQATRYKDLYTSVLSYQPVLR